jgi:hypothetical protein
MQQLVTFLTTVKSSEELTPENVGRQFGVTLAHLLVKHGRAA